MANKLVLLAGLPRTGSTLLANILAQNSRFHLESNSGLCQLMWDMQESCDSNCVEQLTANNKLESVRSSLVGGLPDIYYKGISDKVIFDKCRPWVMPANIKMAKEYISKDIKAIVLVRPINQIIKSFAKLHFKNGGDASIYSELLDNNSEVVMRSFTATYLAAKEKYSNCLFVSYDSIVEDTANVLREIYSFINEDKFIHDVNSVRQVISEEKSTYNLKNIHSIRNKVSKIKNDIVLPEWVEEKCRIMTNALYTEFKGMKNGSLCGTE